MTSKSLSLSVSILSRHFLPPSCHLCDFQEQSNFHPTWKSKMYYTKVRTNVSLRGHPFKYPKSSPHCTERIGEERQAPVVGILHSKEEFSVKNVAKAMSKFCRLARVSRVLGKQKILRLSLMWILRSFAQEVKISPGDLKGPVFIEGWSQGLGWCILWKGHLWNFWH